MAPSRRRKRDECNIEPLPRARPDLFGIDVARSLAEANRGKSHHHATEHNQQQSGKVADDLTARRRGSRSEGSGCDPQEQVELLDQKTERHDGDRGAHPGEKRPLIRRWSLYRSIIGRPRRSEKRPYRGRSASETRAANSLG